MKGRKRFTLYVVLWALAYVIEAFNTETRFTIKRGQRVSSGATEITSVTRAVLTSPKISFTVKDFSGKQDSDVDITVKIEEVRQLISVLPSVALNADYSVQATPLTVIDCFSPGMTSIQCATSCGTECGLFHVSHTNGTCVTFSDILYVTNSGVGFTSDPDWTAGYNMPVTGGDWKLAFRAQKQIGVSVVKTWTNNNLQHDRYVSSNFPLACLQVTDSGSCNRHFRSKILSNWKSIAYVRFSLFKSGSEVAYVLFNGSGSNRDNWFSKSRILAFTWSPALLTENFYKFRLIGECYEQFCRRFQLYGPLAGCDTEWFYTFTVDQSHDVCSAVWSRVQQRRIPSGSDGRCLGCLGPVCLTSRKDVTHPQKRHFLPVS
ncbi:hypothetical protein RRG08_008525 [Elysia crispata]|uniref:Uncharacterized protein n=1 Tax=Elysia crispata TaxID=231223 RepID=A0AAE1ACT9_9GAST|nr:hypothetical protein RRG08_008525 [Elysia crispata]